MMWTNKDWLAVHSALVRLTMFYDLERARNNGKQFFDDEQSQTIELRKKLESLFNDDDTTLEKQEVPSGLVYGSGNCW